MSEGAIPSADLGKIERCHHSMKNQILPENYRFPGELEWVIIWFVSCYSIA